MLGPVADARVRRTRRMLTDALRHLLVDHEFEAISVHDIAARATVNRTTFYDHFPDKVGLLECMVAERFGAVLSARKIVFGRWPDVLRGLAAAVCEYLAELPCCERHQQPLLDMIVQKVIIATTTALLTNAIAQETTLSSQSPSLAVTATAWAISGAANQWLAANDRCAPAVIGEHIGRLVWPLLTTALPPAASSGIGSQGSRTAGGHVPDGGS